MQTFGEKTINFLTQLKPTKNLPDKAGVMNPYVSDEVKQVVKAFYTKYFNDNNSRVFIIGINPGRFGGGITGIGFTDPVALENDCGIENNFPKKRELSSRFIYRVIKEYGGCQKFYTNFFLTAMYPMALVREGKNYNYYDNSLVTKALQKIITEYLNTQIAFGARSDVAICLGKENLKYLSALNHKHQYFQRIELLEHPRYIMQYKQKELGQYLDKYVSLLNSLGRD